MCTSFLLAGETTAYGVVRSVSDKKVVVQFLRVDAHRVERPHWRPTNAQQHPDDLDLRRGKTLLEF